MAGYTINDLKKAGSLSGQDAIPVQQNGITRQFEVGIMDNASLVKQSGSQSSGVIRKAQTFVLQSATKINFTLENAVGRIVTDNEYVDNAEAASGWKVYVVNISSIEHTVIHGANSWPVPAGEILCFYWTGSRFTLHNIVINNVTVRGDTKLLNISAVQALAAANKIPVIGTDGKLASTTAQAIVDLANVDGKINNALANYCGVQSILPNNQILEGKATAQKINFTTQNINTNSNIFEISNGGIKIKQSGTFLIFGQIFYGTGITEGSSLHCEIYQNSNRVFLSQQRCKGSYESVNAQRLLSCNVNDIIYLYGRSENDNSAIILSQQTNLIIQKIA